MNYVPTKKTSKMSRPFKSLVVETVYQLCSRNEDLGKTGVTHKQLHTVLSLRLTRGTSPALITALIKKELNNKTIVKNSLGNYTMDPDMENLDSLLIPEESSSDSNTEIKETESATIDQTDLLDLADSQKSQVEDKSTKNIDESRSCTPDKMDSKEEAESVKPARRQRRRRRTRKPRMAENEQDEQETSERSPSPSQMQTKRTGRSVLVTNSNGRRIIRKITKYDPSEFYLTPLINKRRSKGVGEVPDAKIKRGRPALKTKLARAAAAAAMASATSAPLKKLEQIRKEVRNNKAIINLSKTLATYKPIRPKPLPEPKKEEEDEEEKETIDKVPFKSSASMLKNECYICSELADVSDEKTTLACSLCLNIAHDKCVLDDGFYKDLKKWRCSECLITNPAICSVCDKEYKTADGAMVMCDFCEEMFHTYCHVPPIKLPISSSSWRCSLCPPFSITDALIGGREDLKSTVGTFAFSVPNIKSRIPLCLPTPVLPSKKIQSEPISEETSSQQTELQTLPSPTPLDETVTIKTEIPDECVAEEVEMESKDDKPPSYKFHRPGEPIPKVDNWTSSQVAEYFSERFGPLVGNAFLNQEIDGKSLKLMGRNDVTDQLGLQFGIALKVLYYVKKIQLNTNVIQDLWM